MIEHLEELSVAEELHVHSRATILQAVVSVGHWWHREQPQVQQPLKKAVTAVLTVWAVRR